jgi:prepilin-type N-terminal cleavage/methylation domain-containing protein
MPRSLQQGFTLTELVTTLSVAAILSTVAFPAFSRLQGQIRAETDVQRLQTALAHARYLAAMTGKPITICPLDAAERCDGDWQEDLQIFVDVLPKGRRDPQEELLYEYSGPSAGARLRFRAFRNSRYLRFLPNGQTDWQNGRFVYCPPRSVTRGPTDLVVNVQGRIRVDTRRHAGRC